jgi:hypothetical protein
VGVPGGGPLSPRESGKRRNDALRERQRTSEAISLEALLGERALLRRENAALQEFAAWQSARIAALEGAQP